MEKDTARVDIYSGSQEIPFFLWKLNVHDHVNRSPHVVPILNQINPGHTLTSYFKIHFNIILPSMPRSPNTIPYCTL
jgi:hypothetical protein